jgi:multidrug efflux pump subunit AcrA (membrane-fusion protein)
VSRQKNAEIRQKLKDQEKDIAFILKKQVSTMQKPQLTEAQLELNRQEILATIRGLVLEAKPIKPEQQLRVKQLLQTVESREALAESLFECGAQNRQVKSVDCFKSLAEIVRFVLSVTDFEELCEPKLLYLIL